MEIVDNPAETTTVGYEEWKQNLEETKRRLVKHWANSDPNELHDEITVSTLINFATEPVTWLKSHITAYMTSPVAYYNGRPIEAKTVTDKSITELQMEFMAAIDDDKKVFVYQLSYHSDRIELYTFDNDWNVIPLAEPKYIPGHWNARYTII